MIRKVAMVLITAVVISSLGFSAENRSDEKKKEPAGQQQKGTVNWPAPFQPSEKVGADSQVSFPTDI